MSFCTWDTFSENLNQLANLQQQRQLPMTSDTASHHVSESVCGYDRDTWTPHSGSSGYHTAGTSSPLPNQSFWFPDETDSHGNRFLATIHHGNGQKNDDLIDQFLNHPPQLTRLRSYESRQKEENLKLEQDLYAKIEATKPRRVPPTGYSCHICNQPGHYIQDCPNKDCNAAPTPYRGNKVCYGEFQCPQCNRKWASGSSKAKESKECSHCHIAVFPKKQLAREKAIELGKMTADGRVARRGGFAQASGKSITCTTGGSTVELQQPPVISRVRIGFRN